MIQFIQKRIISERNRELDDDSPRVCRINRHPIAVDDVVV